MNYTSSGNRIRKASFSEIVKHSNWYLGIAITLYILLLTIIGSQVTLWSYFDKSKESERGQTLQYHLPSSRHRDNEHTRTFRPQP